MREGSRETREVRTVRLAIFGDIHANLPALEAVLADIERQRVDALYCLGDLVGYATFPNEVTERIQTLGVPTIMGNYDEGVGLDRDDCGCAYRTAEEQQRGERSIAWTRARVSDENKAFLRSLHHELRIEVDGKRVLLVHGSPRKINEYLFEDRPISSFQRLAASSNADAIVFGHTHKPYTRLVDGVLFLNAGSVGKPKDGDWRACYAILDLTAAEPVEFIRVEYDLATAVDGIRRSDLPQEFATDLELGGAVVAR
jgi:putative phosphoesterase